MSVQALIRSARANECTALSICSTRPCQPTDPANCNQFAGLVPDKPKKYVTSYIRYGSVLE